jgi:hypothetical protein
MRSVNATEAREDLLGAEEEAASSIVVSCISLFVHILSVGMVYCGDLGQPSSPMYIRSDSFLFLVHLVMYSERFLA